MTATVDEMVRLAKQALVDGKTRGLFIREHTSDETETKEYQEWSDAYSIAMQELQH